MYPVYEMSYLANGFMSVTIESWPSPENLAFTWTSFLPSEVIGPEFGKKSLHLHGATGTLRDIEIFR